MVKALGKRGWTEKQVRDAVLRPTMRQVARDQPVRGRVAARGRHDELGGAPWVIVRDTQGQEHYARLKFGQPAPALRRGIELVPTPQGAQIKGPPRSADLGR